ncbi:hypothetical protein [Longitalea arenae]|uniref:hypothetical protein n=1 Tax=Longitalea arenae TaxID=2812558 RepID=UPI0019676DA2|nr:hypothetical protein [Longitalea arenae]
MQVTGRRLPVAGYQLPVAGYRLPVTGGQLPVISCQLPVARYPAHHYRLSVTSRRLLDNYRTLP